EGRRRSQNYFCTKKIFLDLRTFASSWFRHRTSEPCDRDAGLAQRTLARPEVLRRAVFCERDVRDAEASDLLASIVDFGRRDDGSPRLSHQFGAAREGLAGIAHVVG